MKFTAAVSTMCLASAAAFAPAANVGRVSQIEIEIEMNVATDLMSCCVTCHVVSSYHIMLCYVSCCVIISCIIISCVTYHVLSYHVLHVISCVIDILHLESH